MDLMKKVAFGFVLLLGTGISVIKAADKTKESENYLPNTYFTGSGNMANIYVKMLAENILHKHGIQAEVTIS